MKILVISLYDYSYCYNAYKIENGKASDVKITTKIIDNIFAKIHKRDNYNEELYKNYIKDYDVVIFCEDGGCEILEWKSSNE